MHFISILLAGAACVAAVFAQSAPITFTNVPDVMVIGQSYTMTWSGGDGVSPVTITLRQGDPSNLDTISTLTSSASGGSFVWTPSSSLETADDYALQISQGEADINYSAPFSIVGGTVPSSYRVAASIPSNTTSMTSTYGTAASVGTGTTMLRNTTFSSMTLASTAPSISAGPSYAVASLTIASATTTAMTAVSTGGAAQFKSPAAFAVAAIFAVATLY